MHGLAELQAGLEAVALGLDEVLSRTALDAAGLTVQIARPLTPYDPQHESTRDDGLPHIRDSLYATALGAGAAVASSHPGAVVHESGGTIAPAGVPIHIKPSRMAHTAAAAAAPAVTALLEQRISALVRQYFR